MIENIRRQLTPEEKIRKEDREKLMKIAPEITFGSLEEFCLLSHEFRAGIIRDVEEKKKVGMKAKNILFRIDELIIPSKVLESMVSDNSDKKLRTGEGTQEID